MRHRKIENKFTINIKTERKNILWVISGIFIFLQVFITIQNATQGATLANLERQRMELEEKNRMLSEAMVQASSLIQSREKAEELGFVEPQKVVYIKSDEFVAQLP